MKSHGVFAIFLILTACAAAQSSDKRIALTENTKVATGGVLKALNSKRYCAGVTLTGDKTKADYLVEVNKMPAGTKMCLGNSGCPDEEYSGTLFALNGDVLFQTKTHSYSLESLESAVHDVCKAILKQK